jgi:hypothetical protein
MIRLSRCKICLYAADHLPPHFHILASDGREALVEISTLVVLAGGVGKKELTEALEWGDVHQELLVAKWEELNYA